MTPAADDPEMCQGLGLESLMDLSEGDRSIRMVIQQLQPRGGEAGPIGKDLPGKGLGGDVPHHLLPRSRS